MKILTKYLWCFIIPTCLGFRLITCVKKNPADLSALHDGSLEIIEVNDLICTTGTQTRSLYHSQYLNSWVYQENILTLFFKLQFYWISWAITITVT
jgi:hypothetical protein